MMPDLMLNARRVYRLETCPPYEEDTTVITIVYMKEMRLRTPDWPGERLVKKKEAEVCSRTCKKWRSTFFTARMCVGRSQPLGQRGLRKKQVFLCLLSGTHLFCKGRTQKPYSHILARGSHLDSINFVRICPPRRAHV